MNCDNKKLKKLMKEWSEYKTVWDRFKENIYYKQYNIEKDNVNIILIDDIIEFRKKNTNWNNWMDYVKLQLLNNPIMNTLYYDILSILECKINNKDYKFLQLQDIESIQNNTNIKSLKSKQKEIIPIIKSLKKANKNIEKEKMESESKLALEKKEREATESKLALEREAESKLALEKKEREATESKLALEKKEREATEYKLALERESESKLALEKKEREDAEAKIALEREETIRLENESKFILEKEEKIRLKKHKLMAKKKKLRKVEDKKLLRKSVLEERKLEQKEQELKKRKIEHERKLKLVRARRNERQDIYLKKKLSTLSSKVNTYKQKNTFNKKSKKIYMKDINDINYIFHQSNEKILVNLN